jgi:hypothetical protein
MGEAKYLTSLTRLEKIAASSGLMAAAITVDSPVCSERQQAERGVMHLIDIKLRTQ